MAAVRVDPTPNPNSVKITVGQAVSARPVTFANVQAAQADPLASKLFAIPGVASVFMISNFITVTKAPDSNWDDMLGALESTVGSHFE